MPIASRRASQGPLMISLRDRQGRAVDQTRVTWADVTPEVPDAQKSLSQLATSYLLELRRTSVIGNQAG